MGNSSSAEIYCTLLLISLGSPKKKLMFHEKSHFNSSNELPSDIKMFVSQLSSKHSSFLAVTALLTFDNLAVSLLSLSRETSIHASRKISDRLALLLA